MKKIAILSHILPPSPTGQAIMLYQLLKDSPGINYCLISWKNYIRQDQSKMTGTQRLPVKYFFLEPVFQLKVPKKPVLGLLKRWIFDNLYLLPNLFISIFDGSRKVIKVLGQAKSEILLVCTGDFQDLFIAYRVSRKTGIPLMIYIFDDYVYQWTGIRRKIAQYFMPRFVSLAKAVIVPNEFLQKDYFKRYGINAQIIHNGCEPVDIRELDKKKRNFSNDNINIVYTGSIYHAQYNAFRDLIDAVRIINEHCARKYKIKIHIFTSQTKEELTLAAGICGKYVSHHPHISHAEIPVVQRQADFLFLPLAFGGEIPEVIRTSAPGKMAEYLSVGRPILVHAPKDSFVSWYFKRFNCGIVVDEKDPGVLALEIINLIENKKLQDKISLAARKRAEKDFDIKRSRRIFQKIIS